MNVQPLRPLALLVLAGAVLASAPVAWAGGDFVDVAAGGPRVWVVGPFGVRSVDALSGRILSMPQLTGAPYPLSVTVARGATWVAGVENGYTSGTLSRIDSRSGKLRIVWHRSVVQYVAAGAGSVWALTSSGTRTGIARFTLAGRLLRTWRIADGGRMAADRYGCWVSTDRWLLHIDTAGRLHRVVRAPLGDVSTGAGAVWLPRATSVLRVDERTGELRTFTTGRLATRGFQHDLAAADGALWVLGHEGRSGSTLQRFDLRTGRRTGEARVRGIADAVAVRPHALWIASVIATARMPASGYTLSRFDPRSLRRTLLVQIT